METPIEKFLQAQEAYLSSTGWKKNTGKVGKFNSWTHPKVDELYTQPAAVGLQQGRDGYLPNQRERGPTGIARTPRR